ncbi:MAG: hypothetical protein KDA87_07815 [Planctomycetales bacterium]|nr:hypothetical protein [Planctomycetales bacterium]
MNKRICLALGLLALCGCRVTSPQCSLRSGWAWMTPDFGRSPKAQTVDGLPCATTCNMTNDVYRPHQRFAMSSSSVPSQSNASKPIFGRNRFALKPTPPPGESTGNLWHSGQLRSAQVNPAATVDDADKRRFGW